MSPPKIGPTTQTIPTTQVADCKAQLENLIAAHGPVSFRSWNGVMQGTDDDTVLTFLPNGAAQMIEYGFGVITYQGTYTIDASGNVAMQFSDFGQDWPAMILQRDQTSLMLVPKSPRQGFVMGNRGGATILGNQKNFWPFRPLDDADQAQIRKSLNQ